MTKFELENLIVKAHSIRNDENGVIIDEMIFCIQKLYNVNQSLTTSITSCGDRLRHLVSEIDELDNLFKIG